MCRLTIRHENVVFSFYPIDLLYIFREYRLIWTEVIAIGKGDFVGSIDEIEKNNQYLTYMRSVSPTL